MRVELATPVSGAEVFSTEMQTAAASKPSSPPAPSVSLPEPVAVSMDEGHVLVYRFLDPQTGDVVQQIPPEEILKIVHNIQQLLVEQQSQNSHLDLQG